MSVAMSSGEPIGDNATSPPDLDGVRAEVRSWLEREWDPDLTLLQWRQRFVDSGWAVPSWDRRWHGLGLPPWADEVVAREIQALGIVGLPLNGGTVLASSTISLHGPDDLRSRFLRPVLTGEERWCQLFSEPSAGSDLAGLTTRAVLDGDQWIVNGRKVWNTSAHNADFGMLVREPTGKSQSTVGSPSLRYLCTKKVSRCSGSSR